MSLLNAEFDADIGNAVVDHLPVHLVEGVVLGKPAEEGALVRDVVLDAVSLDACDGSHPLPVGLSATRSTTERLRDVRRRVGDTASDRLLGSSVEDGFDRLELIRVGFVRTR